MFTHTPFYDIVMLSGSLRYIVDDRKENSMRDQYWTLYVALKHRSLYYKYFQSLFSTVNWIISAILCLTTLSCIAAWDIWKNHPVLWSSLICISQILQALFPKLPYNDLLISTKFMICSMDKLLLDIEHDWLSINVFSWSDNKILKQLKKRQKHYSKLVNQFFSGTYLPTIRYCEKMAEKECKTFFSVTYKI